MIQTTTNTIEGHPIKEYHGIVTAEAVVGANVFKDIAAGLRDFSAAARAPMKECCAKPAPQRSKNWPKRPAAAAPTPW